MAISADFSPRAREALERADLICAEDTRATLKLPAISPQKPLLSTTGTTRRRAEPVIARMLGRFDRRAGERRGHSGHFRSRPAVADAAWRAGIPVTPVCGPCAAVTAIPPAGSTPANTSVWGFARKEAVARKLQALRKTGVPVASPTNPAPRARSKQPSLARCIPPVGAGGLRPCHQKI